MKYSVVGLKWLFFENDKSCTIFRGGFVRHFARHPFHMFLIFPEWYMCVCNPYAAGTAFTCTSGRC